MKNIKIETKDGKIIITIDATQTHGSSKSGKSTIVASTEGNQAVDTPEGRIIIGVNAYKSKEY